MTRTQAVITAPRPVGGKRLSLVQARLNDNERARLDALTRTTGLSDSAVVRAALEGLAEEIGLQMASRRA